MDGEAREITFTSDGLALEGILHLPESSPSPAAAVCPPHPAPGGLRQVTEVGEGGRRVRPLTHAVGERTFAPAHPSEVEPEGRDASGGCRPAEGDDHAVVHISAVERVGVADGYGRRGR